MLLDLSKDVLLLVNSYLDNHSNRMLRCTCRTLYFRAMRKPKSLTLPEMLPNHDDHYFEIISAKDVKEKHQLKFNIYKSIHGWSHISDIIKFLNGSKKYISYYDPEVGYNLCIGADDIVNQIELKSQLEQIVDRYNKS